MERPEGIHQALEFFTMLAQAFSIYILHEQYKQTRVRYPSCTNVDMSQQQFDYIGRRLRVYLEELLLAIQPRD